MEKMGDLIFFKDRIRFILLTRRKIRKNLTRLYHLIFSVMYRINRSNCEDILSQNKVYINTVLLEEALDIYSDIRSTISQKTIGNTLDLCSHGTVASLLHRFDNQSAWRNDSGDFIV